MFLNAFLWINIYFQQIININANNLTLLSLAVIMDYRKFPSFISISPQSHNLHKRIEYVINQNTASY